MTFQNWSCLVSKREHRVHMYVCEHGRAGVCACICGRGDCKNKSSKSSIYNLAREPALLTAKQ